MELTDSAQFEMKLKIILQYQYNKTLLTLIFLFHHYRRRNSANNKFVLCFILPRMEFLSSQETWHFYVIFNFQRYRRFLTWLQKETPKLGWPVGSSHLKYDDVYASSSTKYINLAYLFSNEIIIDRDLLTDESSNSFQLFLKLPRLNIPIELHHGRGHTK